MEEANLKTPEAPLKFKRYENRKLYCSRTAQYVTTEDVLKAFELDPRVSVVDFNGLDVTVSTLLSAMYKIAASEEKADNSAASSFLTRVPGLASRLRGLSSQILRFLPKEK